MSNIHFKTHLIISKYVWKILYLGRVKLGGMYLSRAHLFILMLWTIRWLFNWATTLPGKCGLNLKTRVNWLISMWMCFTEIVYLCQWVFVYTFVFLFVFLFVFVYMCICVAVYICNPLAPVQPVVVLGQINQLPVGRGGLRTSCATAPAVGKKWVEAPREEWAFEEMWFGEFWDDFAHFVIWLLRIWWELERAEAAEYNKMRLPQVENYLYFICICNCNCNSYLCVLSAQSWPLKIGTKLGFLKQPRGWLVWVSILRLINPRSSLYHNAGNNFDRRGIFVSMSNIYIYTLLIETQYFWNKQICQYWGYVLVNK